MPDDQILRSWKEIADFLGCDVKTCARWEAECGLPIRRFDPSSKRSRVFADKAELQAWLADRKSMRSSGSKKPAKQGGRPYFIGAAFLLLGAPLAWFALKPVLFPPPSPPVIAVLPIPTAGLDVSQAYYAKLINNSLRSQLEFGRRVVVIPLPGLPEASKASGVPARWEGLPEPDFIFQAELRPAENPTALNVSLRDARSGKPVWSQIFDNALSNLNACFKEILSEVGLRISLSDDPSRSAGSGAPANGEAGSMAGGFLSSLDSKANADSWTLYSEALRLADKGDAGANELAIDIFHKIIANEPGFVRAYIGLAQCFANYVNYQGRKEVLWLEKSDQALDKAQTLEPDLPEAYAVRIKNLMMREFLLDCDTSREYFRLAAEALARYPYDGRLCGIIGFCHFKRFDRKGDQADLAEARRLLQLSFNIDPRSLMNMTLAEILMLKGEFDEALVVCSEVEREHPLAIVTQRRGEILYYQGDLAGSLAALRSCTFPLSVRIESLQYEAMIAARRGDRSRAFAVLQEIEVLIPRREAVYYDYLREASVYAGLGEHDRAEALLGEGLAKLGNAGTFIMRSYLEIDPNFKGLRRNLVLSRGIPALQPK